MWCYPNLYTDEGRSAGKGDGKELCDLLVVFGNHVLIFSDKHCEFPDAPTLEIAWARWYRRAVEKSVRQLLGAQSWIARFPDRVFLDKACQVRFPLSFPNQADTKFHLVAVTRGAYSACEAYYARQSLGSLTINTEILGDKHLGHPFSIGLVRPNGPYVHVLDELTLNAVLRELDTIHDLTDYFARKEELLLSSKRILIADGEEQLVAMYLTNVDDLGRHNFVNIPDDVTNVYFPEGHWESFIRSPQYLAKKKADEISYAWDRLIEHLTAKGEVGLDEDRKHDLGSMEPALRILASESRLARRQLADQLVDALSHTVPPGSRFLRLGYAKQNMSTAYVYLVLPTAPFIKSYADYRDFRRTLLLACCKVARLRLPSASRIVGIATEPRGSHGASEDLVLMDFEASPWDSDQELEARMLQEKLGILLDGKATYYERHEDEYPT